tara:strand:- start:4738 stop:5463 length:726 start_codon:yes stop_codon:yes gene_type:complete
MVAALRHTLLHNIEFISCPQKIKRDRISENMPKETKDKKDLSMTDEKWNKRISRIEDWLENPANEEFLNSSEDIQDACDLIRMNIRRGNRSSDKRKNLWNQILMEGRDWTAEKQELLTISWPVAVGKESNLPPHIQDALKNLAGQVEEVYTAFWNDNPIVQQITVISDRNKELGGSPHEDADAFASARVLAVKQRFTKYFNDKRWDGGLDLEAGFNVSAPLPEETPTTEAPTEAGDSSDDS